MEMDLIKFFAVLMKCECIHRRDSDVLIDKSVNGEYVYSIQIELSFMDKEIKKEGVYCWGSL